MTCTSNGLPMAGIVDVFTGEFRAGKWRIEVWEAPSLPDRASADQWLVAPRGDGIRASVIDGVTATSRTPRGGGLSGDLWGAGILRTAMLGREGLERCAREANAELHHPGLPGRDQPQATFVGADLDSGGLVRLARAGDCEAWVERDGGWEALLTGEILECEVRERLLAQRRAEPAASHERVADLERRLLAAPSAWHTTPVGRFAAPRFETAVVERWDRLVLATDGARLSPRRLADLDAWLKHGLRAWEREHRAQSLYRHGDLAVVRITRAGAG